MKLIATDMDGTLLNDMGRVSRENTLAIKHAQNKGVQVVVVTGRPYSYALMPLQEAGLNCPIIALNGAEIRDEQGEILKKLPLQKEYCRMIQKVLEKESVYIEFFTNVGVFSKSMEQYIDIRMQLKMERFPDADETLMLKEVRKRAEERFKFEHCRFVDDFEGIYQDEELIIYKILVLSADMAALERIGSQLAGYSEFTITSSERGNMEFNHPDAQKGLSLKTMADQFKIEMKDVMALGDHLNDLSMLQMAGRGVAMGNASNEVKELCSYSTKTNIEHGVACAIEEILECDAPNVQLVESI